MCGQTMPLSLAARNRSESFVVNICVDLKQTMTWRTGLESKHYASKNRILYSRNFDPEELGDDLARVRRSVPVGRRQQILLPRQCMASNFMISVPSSFQ